MSTTKGIFKDTITTKVSYVFLCGVGSSGGRGDGASRDGVGVGGGGGGGGQVGMKPAAPAAMAAAIKDRW